jgi:hypothetical protein
MEKTKSERGKNRIVLGERVEGRKEGRRRDFAPNILANIFISKGGKK